MGIQGLGLDCFMESSPGDSLPGYSVFFRWYVLISRKDLSNHWQIIYDYSGENLISDSNCEENFVGGTNRPILQIKWDILTVSGTSSDTKHYEAIKWCRKTWIYTDNMTMYTTVWKKGWSFQ